MRAFRVALAGNPNVGKSTLFNALTGLRQHTGNWPGKTVALAQGSSTIGGNAYTLVDLPGTYSLLSHSPEEQVARSFLCQEAPDAVIAVCDGTALERGLNLVLQILEITPRVLVCVNLLDEAAKKGIGLRLELLAKRLGVPVVGVVARDKGSLENMKTALNDLCLGPDPVPIRIPYPPEMEAAVEKLTAGGLTRFQALKLLEGEPSLLRELGLWEKRVPVRDFGLDQAKIQDSLASTPVLLAEKLCQGVVTYGVGKNRNLDRQADRILTGKYTGTAVMLGLLAFVFWLTIVGANFLSDGLTRLFGLGEEALWGLCQPLPGWLRGILVQGAWRTTAWVVAVMLPPMGIFFPLFTLLEDVGYLPRIAFNLDKPFHRCKACGKQALTMCMGFGCNAAGVVGCRIIDSPRERLLAILTNSLVPCNGRFPLLITLVTLFFAGGSSLLQAAIMTAAVAAAVGATLGVTALLSATVLRGQSSAFALELPSYRVPQVGKVLVRSALDRTLFVLGRAAAVAAPAGMVLWILANCRTGSGTLLSCLARALEPMGTFLGLDGVLLLAFLLGLPANEIVLPIALMAYLSQSSLQGLGDPAALKTVLLANGWCTRKAVCTVIFTLFHWPCSTTLLTVYKETNSRRWTALAAILPTALGAVLCSLVGAMWG